MFTLNEIAGELRDLLADSYRTVRVTTVQTTEQLLAEIKAINPDKLPGVLLVFESFQFTNENSIREIGVSLVLVDRFVAGSEDRALSVLESTDKLLKLFPPEGREISGVFAVPTDCQAACPDKSYACVALGLTLKQLSI